jgi:superfamily II DNA or RNA helicase
MQINSIEFREKIQKEAIEALLSNDRVSIDCSVRLGKSKIGLEVAKTYNKVLVSYPFKSICDSWKSESIKFGIDISHITFTTHISLPKHNLNEFEAIIIDEIQDLSEGSWLWVEECNPKVIKGLSGTMPIKGVKRDYIDTYAPIGYTKTLDETTGYTSKPYNIIVHMLSPSTKKDILLKSGKSWSEEAKIRFWESKYKQDFNFKTMIQLIQTIQNSKTKLDYMAELAKTMERGLLFVETSKQCDALGYLSYHSKEKESEENLKKFQEGEINTLSTISQLRSGITFPNLKECIILHCYASNNKAHQKLARCLNYAENEEATIHILCLKGTRDEIWITK